MAKGASQMKQVKKQEEYVSPEEERRRAMQEA